MRNGTTLGRLSAVAVLAALFAPAAWAGTPVEFVYVTNYWADTVSAYRLDASTGALEEVTGSPFATGMRPLAAAVEPTNRFLYVVNNESRTLSGFAIGAAGDLTAVPGSPFAASLDMTSVVAVASGRFLYVTDAALEKIFGYRIDATNGALTSVGSFPLGNNAGGLRAHPSGRFLYANASGGSDGISGYTIDPSTGWLTRIAGMPILPPSSMAIDASGRYLYGANSQGVSAFLIHPTTGFPALISNSPAGDVPWNPAGVAVTPSRQFVYVANFASSRISGYTLDDATGGLSPLAGSPFAASASLHGPMLDPSGRFAYFVSTGANAVFGYSVGSGGALTALPSSPFATGSSPVGIAATHHDLIFSDGFESGDLGANSFRNEFPSR